MTGDITNGGLAERIANGDREAFADMYNAYLKNLYRYIFLIAGSHETSEEIIQSTFVKIWENRERLAGVVSLKSYVFRTAKNLLFDQIRRSQVESRILELVTPQTEIYSDNSDSKIIYNQYLSIIEDAFNQLPNKRRQIVELRTKEDLSLDEIAETLKISKSVVKKQLYRGLDTVREYIKKHGELTISILLLICKVNNL